MIMAHTVAGIPRRVCSSLVVCLLHENKLPDDVVHEITREACWRVPEGGRHDPSWSELVQFFGIPVDTAYARRL